MLKLSFLEFFIRLIPEAFLVIFSVYTFSTTDINVKRYFISSMIFSIMVFIIRLLPIHYGVHTILGIVVIIILAININKIDIVKSIRAVIITTIIQFICEGINVFIIQNVLCKDINYIFNNPLLKILYGTPSMVLSAIVVIISYKKLLKGKK